ncbi:hypothetical protein GQ457_04G017710 [Hibiscus cannabinus]
MSKLFVWNVQGFGDPNFLTTVRQFIRDNNPYIIKLFEPRSGYKANSVILALGVPNSHRIEASGFSGGIWLCWKNTITTDILLNHFQFLHFRVHNIDGSSSLVTLIYARPNAVKRNTLWIHLHSLSSSIHSSWLLYGNFNTTLHTVDRKGCSPNSRPSRAFQDLVLNHGLQDTEFQEPEYTWTQGDSYVRLNRMLCNTYWDATFPMLGHSTHIIS